MMRPSVPLVLLHGFTGCGEVWDDVRAALPEVIHCMSPDLPGHGSRTDVTPDNAFTFEGVCAQLRETLKGAGTDGLDLWGYSMGGRIALHFALTYPDLIHSLILEGASPGIADAEERCQRLRSDEQLAARLLADGLEQFVREWMKQALFASQKSLPLELQERGRELRMKSNAAGLSAALRGFSVGRQEPLHNRLQELTMPVLLITGSLDRKYCAIAESMAHSIPQAQLRIIPEAGHAPHWERPQETAAVVLEFLGSPQHVVQ
jgi:2-succinyl-6-hydroxy-2,4-cyclohexadiene-1-carboxylate synthase